MFPVIQNLNDLLPHIQGNDNISVNKKDDYIVVNYILNTPEMFNNAWEKECRGIIFAQDDGRLLSRPLHKFFNLNERPETFMAGVDLSQEHNILEKLDGSMCRPFETGGKIRWGSKAGLTFVTDQVEEFVKEHSEYQDFANFLVEGRFTGIFEWCSRKNRIVLDYPEDHLVLLAIRNNLNGGYISYEEMCGIVCKFWPSVDIVEALHGSVRNIQHLSDKVSVQVGIEGFVISFQDGRKVKLKTEEYRLLHKSKESLCHEKNVIEILASDKADDFRTLLTPFDREAFELFEKKFWVGFCYYLTDIQEIHEKKFNSRICTRKDLGLYGGLSQLQKMFLFKFFDKEVTAVDIQGEILEYIKKRCTSQSSVDQARETWGGIKWVY